MALNKVEFFKHVQDKNGGKFEFRYEGIDKNNNIDVNKVNELIEKFTNQIIYHGDMVDNVRFLRAILKDYDEELLFISYRDKEIKETVRFDNLNMALFKKSEIDKENESTDSFVVEYNPENNINFMLTDSFNNKIEYSNFKNISDKITKVLTEIDSLNHIKPIKLDRDSKIIIEIYKLFYNENPDFSDKNIDIKIQTMMSILKEFGISMDEYRDFTPSLDKKMPISFGLSSLVYKLFPLGEITEIENPIQLSKESKRVITIVSEEIREAIENIDNKEDALITISKIIHSASNFPSTAKLDEIAQYTNSLTDEVESNMKLVKKINNILNQE